MTHHRIPALAASLLVTGAVLAAAPAALAHAGDDHGGDHGAPATQSVTLNFTAVNGSAPVTCGTPITNLGTTGATAELQDLRFYISNVRLIRANGRSVPLTLARNDAHNLTRGGNRVTLIDLEDGRGRCTVGDAAINRVIRGTVPKGAYVGATMYMGVPFPLNHTDITANPAPLNILAMDWNWQAGRKFAKIEVVDPGGAAGTWKSKSFLFHLGSTGCLGNPATGATTNCLASNRMTVTFPRFDPARQRIAVDVRSLLAGNDITVNRAGAPGCMSGGTDPECEAVFASLRVGWKADGTGSGRPVERGAGQTLFRVVSR